MKKNLLSFFAVAIAIAASAFTFQSIKTVEEDTFYYGYDSELEKYRLIEGVSNPSVLLDYCDTGDEVCIRILETEGEPPATIEIEAAEELEPYSIGSNHEFNFSEYENQ
jgi:hypothetical protein